ncbi:MULTISPECIES: preprotein translocase subunit SecA [Micromonospora]|uniref:Protein translocase subunit SecA n=1 Tax=Micromonospora rifamycinica TaxID=291594 RepID=A0A109ILK4_9ACTN|nr:MULTISPECIES: preprotein translocase subunit SecA [Micromonospora]KWV32787.1 preprotein translocase subunit SecA [Micromonospora rifamycinica]WFE64094.1 preprotein translocase subunit SecA [Micromonospora sp. WMMD714]SCG59372.1 protein translocase subunit secA [Micromonospora rifamycinica]
MSILERVLRAGEGRMVRRLKAIAAAVNSIEDDYVNLTDDELRSLTDQYRERLADGETLDDLLPEAFATVREAAARVLGQRPYDVQVMGGAALHFGNIAEMKTGEGKTLTSVMAVYLNALSGKGVHVVTVNDYLAQRDAAWMGQVHEFLGLTVGVVLPNRPAAEHKAAYECDITYGTNNEFGFDYLRDNMAWSHEELVQRGHNFAVVDEVDSILIDEARTPLIISGPAEHSARWYGEFAGVVARLQAGKDGEGDYEVDYAKRTIAVTERGVAKVEDRLGIDNLYESVNTPLVGYLNNAIKAKELYKRDKDYIVSDGEVLIVDEFTGRILHGRRYNEGMHQAIEAKEGVEIKQENQTLATITLQNYFRLYEKLSGMTGTAQTEAGEFNKVYKVGVVTIPTHRPMVRMDKADVIYKTEKAKFNAVIEDIAERHQAGQPVLVGTVSVENSEILSTLLRRRGIPHSVLNAKFHAREAEIVAQAGRKGAVTVATNMAGRGTDILLGGNAEFLAASELRQRGLDPVEQADEYAKAMEEVLPTWKQACETEAEEVAAAGGLYVLGTERHESRRIDNQLRGRAGRQGDPGESRFYLSLQDELMKRFRAGAVEAVMERFNIPEDVPIESKMVTRQIKNAQAQIEGQNAEIRKNVLKYDEVLNKQRQVIYAERLRVLNGEDLSDQVRNMIDDTVGAYVVGATSDGYAEDWDLDQLWTNLKQLYPVGVTIDELEEEVGSRSGLDQDFLLARLKEDANAAYDRREESLGEEATRQLERMVLLQVIDRKWREHLYEMDYLQEGISLRAYAQRDPVIEYQREGFDMFATMMEGIKEETVGFLYNLEVQVQEPEPEAEEVQLLEKPVEIRAKGLNRAPQQQGLQYSAPTIDGEAGAGGVAVERPEPEPSAPALGIGGGQQQAPSPARPAAGPSRRPADAGATGQAAAASTARRNTGPVDRAEGGPSRNAPCPCGSGRKYKRCHGAPNGGA